MLKSGKISAENVRIKRKEKPKKKKKLKEVCFISKSFKKSLKEFLYGSTKV